jgi:hypothetical protein
LGFLLIRKAQIEDGTNHTVRRKTMKGYWKAMAIKGSV